MSGGDAVSHTPRSAASSRGAVWTNDRRRVSRQYGVTIPLFINRVFAAIGYFLLFLMLFVPSRYQPIKAGLLALLLVAITIHAFLRQRVSIHPIVIGWTALIVATGLTFMGFGAVNGAPGSLRVGTVYVLWPIVYTILIGGLTSIHIFRGIVRVLVLAAIAISSYGLLFLLVTRGVVPERFYIALDQGQATGFNFETQEFNLFSLSTLLFLIPFLLTATLTWPQKLKLLIGRRLLWIATATALTAAFLSGRRGLWLVISVSPIIALVARAILPQANRTRRLLRTGVVLTLAAALILGALQATGAVNAGAMMRMFVSAFDLNSETARQEQIHALIRGWSDSPFIGAGHGAVAPGSIRSLDLPWSYELTYLALLFHTGVVGFILYSLPVLWIYWAGFKVCRAGGVLGLMLIPVLAGMTGFLLANATNPYLAKFDFMWVIFLPVAIINLHLMRRARTSVSKRLLPNTIAT